MSKIAQNVQCIVIEYHGELGKLLLKPRSIATLDDLADQYYQSECDSKFWIASFDWASILPKSEELQVAYHKKMGRVLLRAMILGRRGVCTICQNQESRWRAVSFEIESGSPPALLPPRCGPSRPPQAQPLAKEVGFLELVLQPDLVPFPCESPFIPGDKDVDAWRIHGC